MNKPRLTIELVPKTCWYSNVRSNVPKEHWNIIRKQVYINANYVCEVCGGVGSRHPVECHEVWHYDDDTHMQTLDRMIALCPACHEVKHIGRTSAYGGLFRAVNHLKAVNEWTDGQTRDYVAKQTQIWENRSKHQWKLDIRILSKYVKMGKIESW